MNNLDEQLKKLSSIKLSQREREELKQDIDLRIRVSSVRKQRYNRLYTYRSFLSAIFLTPIRPMTGIAIGLIVLLGGGTSVAAQGALPGDTLYPIKVEVNERVEGLFAIGTEADADWESRRAERRLEEAEQLALEGRLNAATRSEIESRFEAHVQSALEHAQELSGQEKEEIASRIQSRLESAFSAHASVLSEIKEDIDDEETESNVMGLENKVRAHITDAVQARLNTETSISARSDMGIEMSAEHMRQATEAQIERLVALAERAELSAEAQAEADTAIEESQNLMAEGDAQLETEDFRAAYRSFVEAFQTAIRARVLLQFDVHFNTRGEADMTGETRSERADDASGNRADEAEDNGRPESVPPEESDDTSDEESDETTEDDTAENDSSTEAQAEVEVSGSANTRSGDTDAEGFGRVKVQFGI